MFKNIFKYLQVTIKIEFKNYNENYFYNYNNRYIFGITNFTNLF